MREPFYRLTEESRLFLSRGYLVDGQEPEDRVRDIANHAEKLLGIEGFADKFYDYMSKGYYSLSSPVWSNYGLERGLPISCFGVEVQDYMGDILHGAGELGMMSKLGGGVGLYFGNLRSRGTDINGNGTSSGSVHFMEMYDKITSSISQGGTRRGSSSPYISVDHGDILEFLEIGSEGNPIQGSNTGVVIPEGRMQDMIDGDKDKRKVWAKVLQSRAEKGFPYLMFKDNCDKGLPQCYKDIGITAKTSQLCNEIILNTDENHSFVCCLSSINLVHRDEIEQTDAVQTMICFLDSVITEFLNKLESYRDSNKEEDKKTFHYMEKAHRFANRERALGLGVLGRHHLLQSKMIPFESDEAKELNKRIFYTIKRESEICSAELAKMFGEPELLKGYGQRHSTCVPGDVKILTNNGYIKISESVDKDITIWNGYKFSNVKPFYTGKKKTYDVKLSNGFSLECSGNHIFKVCTAKREASSFSQHKVIDIECSKLRVGDCMQRFEYPVIEDGEHLEHPYTNGFYSGDGSISNARDGKYPRKEIRLYGEKIKCKDYIAWKSSRDVILSGLPAHRGYLVDGINDKFFVPINYSLKSKLERLSGICDSDGSYNKSHGISISSINEKFLLDIALMLQTMGCYSSVSKYIRKSGYGLSDGGERSIFCILIGIQSINRLMSLGFTTHRLKLQRGSIGFEKSSSHKWVEVISIECTGEEKDVYCFNEPLNHTGVFNGVMTGQCTAIAPTKSSSFILGNTSQSIEPCLSNYYIKDLAKTKVVVKNPYLVELLKEKKMNTREVRDSIMDYDGSVQHIDGLTHEEKEVFKTFREIDMQVVIDQAADRQVFIDQSQSLNIMVTQSMSVKDVNELIIDAWKKGIKTLYYQFSISAAQEASRKRKIECIGCSG